MPRMCSIVSAPTASRCSENLYHFAGQSNEQRQMVDRLADTYSRHLIQVTNLIHTKPRRLREFADAFKIRKERS